jgi:hypothetical protein
MTDEELAQMYRSLMTLIIEQQLRRLALQMALTEAGVPLTTSRLDQQYDDARAASQELLNAVQYGSLEDLRAQVAGMLRDMPWLPRPEA